MLYARWLEIVREHARETALVDGAGGRRWTFAQLANEAERFSLPGGRVIPAHGHSPDFVLAVLAAWRSERPLLPMDGGPTTSPLPADLELDASVAHLKATSGTTGVRQLIAFTAEQLAADADQIVATMGLRPDQPNLGVISLAHSYGFSNLVTPLLLHGIPLILCPSPIPETVRAAANGHASLALPAVPVMWRAWHEAGAIPPQVDLAISAGAPLPLELEAAVHQRSGLKLHNFYGSSECGGIAFDRTTVPRSDAACAGTPLEGVNLSLDSDGCLVVEGAAVGLRYLPHGNDRLAGGKFRTSDVALLQAGTVLLRGRASDVINVAGRKLAPEFVEQVLRDQPGVRDCVVFGVPSKDPVRIEEVVVALSLTDDGRLETVTQGAGRRLAAWQLPRHWWPVTNIAANHLGKISRREWRRRFLEDGRTQKLDRQPERNTGQGAGA
ncbi:MAG TPA: hypothetical protein DCY13_11250 [Verrucomicrobiales bacterium]|nr:hypothetical protein [Verrucomicrobiales bacterium]